MSALLLESSGADPGRLGAGSRAGVGTRARARAATKELGIAASVYVLYWFGRMVTQGADAAAARNARWVIDLERSLGAFNERTVQRWAMDVPGVIEFLNRYYVWIHFPASIAFLVWVFVRRRTAFAMIRTWFTVVTLAALVIHVAFPLAPPRMTPGFVDTLDVFGPDIYSNDPGGSVANQFAAMPSLHFGWALMVAIGIGRLTTRSTRAWMVHPVITLLAIVATGNHYWIDAAVAGVLVVVAVRWVDRPVARGHAGTGFGLEPDTEFEPATT
jgi:hypothetical protein